MEAAETRARESAGPAPRGAVRSELARTLLGFSALPLQALDFAVRRGALRQELTALLETPAEIDAEPDLRAITQRRLRVFVSAAEASGEIHASNTVSEMRAAVAALGAAPPAFAGLGGKRLAAGGVDMLGDPVQRATMGFDGVVTALPYYLDLLETCATHFRDVRPHVALLVDSPALHVPLARIARRYGVRVVHFVTPQHWAWAPWRTANYARSVDRALTILPFEPAWFRRRGVEVAHVGHPLVDELASVPATRAAPSCRTIALLPGSRRRVIDLNLPWMLQALAKLRERMPEVDAVVLQADDEHRFGIEEHVAGARASDWARVEIGDLHAALGRSRAALSVSGTVLLDLLHHRLPAVCIYRVARRREVWMYRSMLATPWFASPNLLAGREVVQEFCFRGRGPLEAVAGALAALCEDSHERRRALAGLELAHERLGPPGACRRAAMHALQLASDVE